MVAVIIKIDEAGPRVISLGSVNDMKSKMLDFILCSETGFQRFDNDFGYCSIRVTELEGGEKKVVKYILQILTESV